MIHTHPVSPDWNHSAVIPPFLAGRAKLGSLTAANFRKTARSNLLSTGMMETGGVKATGTLRKAHLAEAPSGDER